MPFQAGYLTNEQRRKNGKSYRRKIEPMLKDNVVDYNKAWSNWKSYKKPDNAERKKFCPSVCPDAKSCNGGKEEEEQNGWEVNALGNRPVIVQVEICRDK